MASVQYSSHPLSPVYLESSFSSAPGTGAKNLLSVRSVQFISRALPVPDRTDLAGIARFGSGSVQSIESPVVWEEQRSSFRSLPAEIPARRPGVLSLEWMDDGALCLRYLLACPGCVVPE